MINKNYAKAYTEVLEILSLLPINDYSKIPKHKIEYYYANKDFEYNYQYNFENPIFSKETAAIIVNLYKNYIASNQEKKKIESILDLNSELLEKEKKKKYNPNDIFKDKEKIVDKVENNLPITVKEDSFFKRFIDYIKRFFGGKN